MIFKFHLNGTEFRIDEYLKGYAWVTKDAEQCGASATIMESQQDAMDTVQRQAGEADADQLEEAKHLSEEDRTDAYLTLLRRGC